MSDVTAAKHDALEAILASGPVVAVVVIDDAKHAVPMARALVAGGVRAIEITLRTPAALDAIRAIANEVEGALVGAGTLLTAKDFADAEKAGARFGVSPGTSPLLLAAASSSSLPYLPGAATASEAMSLLERGYRFQKFFPAEAIGGVAALRGLASPLPQIKFCPTGGVTPQKMADYFVLPNVVCVGGSWLTPATAMKFEDWNAIESLARAATTRPN